MRTADEAAGAGVAEGGVVDGALREIERLVVGQVPAPALIEHAVRVRRARAHAEQGAREPHAYTWNSTLYVMLYVYH